MLLGATGLPASPRCHLQHAVFGKDLGSRHTNQFAAVSLTQVGDLLTNSGPVVMRDNGVLTLGLGGYVLIVDGTFGYYYLLSGLPYTNSFGAS